MRKQGNNLLRQFKPSQWLSHSCLPWGGARFFFAAFDFLNFVFDMVVGGGAVEGRLGVGGGE